MTAAPTEARLLDALKAVVDPLTGKDFVSTRQLKRLAIDGGAVSFEVELGYPAKSQHEALRTRLTEAARSVEGVGEVQVSITTNIIAHAVQRGVALLPTVKNI